jgi:hypothetical protein
MNYLDLLAPARRKVFVSFHHKDQWHRNEWDRLTSGIFINKSVYPGDIDTDNSAEYIARLIRQDFISDASVLVVLIGPKTYCRKHVDWEIAAALDPRTGGRSGLLGIILPNHPDFGPGKTWTAARLPGRLGDNAASEYARIYDWTMDVEALKTRVNFAFDNRITLKDNARNGRPQMAYNTCD